nr:uncharacterized protein LOC123002821 [Drosophila takahashii]
MKFKCIFQNVNGLRQLYKRAELEKFILKHRPNAMLIAEHRLSDTHNPNLSQYQFTRQRPNNQPETKNRYSKASVAIATKNGMKYQQLNLPATINIEAVAIQICYLNRRQERHSIVLVTLYKRPGTLLHTGDLNNIINHINEQTNNSPIIIGCDLNAKHPSWHIPNHNPRHLNSNGQLLYDWLTNQPNLTLLSTIEPTRPNQIIDSSIDFFICSNELSIETGNICKITKDFPSDHFGVEIKLNLEPFVLEEIDPKKIYNFKQMDSLIWNRTILTNLSPVPNCLNQTSKQIDNHIIKLNQAIDKALNSTEAIPIIKIDPKKPNKIVRPSPTCLQLIKHCRYLRRYLFRHIFSLSSHEKQYINNEIKLLKEEINNLLKISHINYIQHKIQHLKPRNISLKTLKLTQPNHRNQNIILTPVEIQTIDITTPAILKTEFDKINGLAWSFERIHKQNDSLSTANPQHQPHANLIQSTLMETGKMRKNTGSRTAINFLSL